MSLSEIKNKLYKKKEKSLYQHAESEFDARSSISGSGKLVEKFSPQDENIWNDPNAIYEMRKKTIKKYAIAGGIALLTIFSLWSLYKIRLATFDFGRVTLSTQGLNEIKSGELITYEITYKNNNRAKLKNVILRLNYPENFRVESDPNFKEETSTTGTYSIGTIKGKGEGKIVLKARTYYSEENLIYLKSELSYTPSILSATYVTKDQYGISVATAPVFLSVEIPQVVANGDTVEYLIKYKNSGNETFEELQIKTDFPSGFSFMFSDPEISEHDGRWIIGNLESGQEGRISVKGKLEGQSDETKKFITYVGIQKGEKFLSYIEKKAETRIIYPALAISQIINSADTRYINAGDRLNYEIRFANMTNVTLKDLIVTEKIDSLILDYTTLSLESGGHFDPASKTITWKALNYDKLKSLDPGNVGSIKFSIKVKDILPIDNTTDKNFIYSSFTNIGSEDINSPLNENKTILGNQINLKLNSRLVLNEIGLYGSKEIPNSGPMPPVSGQETTYTIYWVVKNIFNDVKDAKVTAVLPTNVFMTGKNIPENENVVFNERNNTITWNIGNLAAGTGIISDPKMVAFQIKLIPLPEQVSRSAQLIGPAMFSAKDLFTDQNLVVSVKEKTTYLSEDPTIISGKVMPAQ